MNLRAAIAQIDCTVGDLRENVDRHLEFINRAIRQKAKLILFPELSLTGYTLRDLAWEVAIDPLRNPLLRKLLRKSNQISIACGCVENGENHAMYNSALFLEDGRIRHTHRKLYLPTYGMFEEGRYFSRGRSLRSFDSKHGRFGMLICEDVWHMSVPYALTMDGAEALLCLTASPTRIAGDKEGLATAQVNHEHHRTYARLLGTYFLFSNRVGFEDGVNFWGGSSVTDPSGESLTVAKTFEEDLLIAELSSENVRRARRLSRHVLDEDPALLLRALQRIVEMREQRG
ncbi:MAG TPA: nitrilase-related carbon-nitrogen hydrolase [Bacteroidota bacterium]|nr:nitrilase-related carbon-nitrogen hydrolase [Bacteroidota bacterium]